MVRDDSLFGGEAAEDGKAFLRVYKQILDSYDIPSLCK